MTDEQNERAARVWREACGAYEDNSHDLTLSIRDRTLAGDQAAAAIIAADRAELVERVKVLEEAGRALLEACYLADANEDLPEQVDGSLLDAMRDALWPVIWTQKQVDALNAFQACDHAHPFTCPNRDTREHLEWEEGGGVHPPRLEATPQGWVCNSCNYRQFWAHGFMFDGPPPHPRKLLTRAALKDTNA